MADAVSGQQAGLEEDRAGGLGLPGERRPEQADHALVPDDLRRDLGGLLRVALGVELLDLDLAARGSPRCAP